MPTTLKSQFRQEENFMSLLARVFLLVIFLGTAMLGLITNVDTGYAEASSVSAKGGARAIEQNCSEIYGALAKMKPLVTYTVLSLFLEIVLTLFFKAEQVFTWLQGKTWKTPVAIGFGLLAAWGLNLDIFKDVLEALTGKPSWANDENTKAYYSILMNGIDGILLAGGNHSFYRIFAKLGIHDPFERLVRAAA